MSTVIDRDAGLTLVSSQNPRKLPPLRRKDDVLTPGGHQGDERDNGVDGAQHFPGHEHALTIDGEAPPVRRNNPR